MLCCEDDNEEMKTTATPINLGYLLAEKLRILHVGFRGNFHLVGHIGNLEKEFSDDEDEGFLYDDGEEEDMDIESKLMPYDIKLSHRLGLIVVSDWIGGKINFFDMDTKALRAILRTPSLPFCLGIDSNDCDAIVFSCEDGFVYKYRRNWLEKFEFVQDWKSDPLHPFSCPQHVVCDGSLIYVADPEQNVVKVLNARTGFFVKMYNIPSPKCMQMNEKGQLVVLSGDSTIQIISVLDGKVITMIENLKSIDGFVLDTANHNIIVCVMDEYCVKIVDYNGTILKQSDDMFPPEALCLNQKNGELYIVSGNTILIMR